jgi:hypothetical protein
MTNCHKSLYVKATFAFQSTVGTMQKRNPPQRLQFNQRCGGAEIAGWELAPRGGAENASPANPQGRRIYESISN